MNEDATPIPIIDMARKVVLRTLKPSARLKYINMGGPKLHNKTDIIELVSEISEILDAEQEVEQERRQKGNHNDGNHNRGGNQANAQSNKDKRDNAPCRKHEGKHKWKDCPDNWSNKDKNSSAQGNSTSRNPKS